MISTLYIAKEMSDPIQTKRGNPAMYKGGPSLNPHGRPRVGDSLANAVRQRFSPERIAELAGKLAESAESEQVRLSALQLLSERGYGKVVSVVDATISSAHAAPERDWSAMPIDERRELLARLRGVPQLDGES